MASTEETKAVAATERGIGGALADIAATVAMVIAFYALVTPVALLLRAFGRDPLRLRFEPGLDSYWVKRDPDQGSSSMNSQS